MSFISCSNIRRQKSVLSVQSFFLEQNGWSEIVKSISTWCHTFTKLTDTFHLDISSDIMWWFVSLTYILCLSDRMVRKKWLTPL